MTRIRAESLGVETAVDCTASTVPLHGAVFATRHVNVHATSTLTGHAMSPSAAVQYACDEGIRCQTGGSGLCGVPTTLKGPRSPISDGWDASWSSAIALHQDLTPEMGSKHHQSQLPNFQLPTSNFQGKTELGVD